MSSLLSLLRGVSGAHALLLGLALSAACGGNGNRPTTPPDEPEDSGSDANHEVDSGVPLPRQDAGPDARVPGMPDPGLMGACSIDSNKIFTVAERDTPFSSAPLAVDPVNSRFALPFIGNGDCLEAVHMSTLDGAATSGAPVSGVAVDECSLVRDAVTAALNDTWLVALVDNRKPPYDLWVEPYDSAHAKMGAGQRISEGSSVEMALALTALRSGESAMLAWSDEDDSAGQSLYARPLDKRGAPSGDAVLIEQSKTLYYRGLALRALGNDGAGLVYWRYSVDLTTSDIVFVALDRTGKPLRSAWVLASDAGSSASVDLAIDEVGGAIVFGRAESMTGRQLWFQEIDDTGQAATLRTGSGRAPALLFLNAPSKGIDVSVAKLGTSYAVAYRALPTTNQTMAQIRLYFLDRYGAVIGNSDVSFTSASGGRTAIQAAYDGRVVVGWSQVNEDGKSVTKVVRLPCVGG
jgi:hypothetical protein